ncbi:MAG: hypothetical protein HZA62_14690 [Rhodocyclales bacterium]|nr:hypothetical protein [Rhodocyclales bacterium]
MSITESSPANSSFMERLRTAGIEPSDSAEVRLNKSLLMLTTGLASIAIVLWVAIYWTLGPVFSASMPLVFQLLLAGNMLLYLRTRNFDYFRISQLVVSHAAVDG